MLWSRHRGLLILLMLLAALISMIGLWLQSTARSPTPVPVTSAAALIPASAASANNNIVLGIATATPLPMGQAAPEFSLMGIDGKPHQLREYRGYSVVLNFWATWCGPCRLEMPLLEETYSRFKLQGLAVIGINMLEDRSTVQDYVRNLKIAFPILLTTNVTVADSYGVVGLPTTFFIDAKGVMRDKHIGLLTEEALQQHLDDLATFDTR